MAPCPAFVLFLKDFSCSWNGPRCDLELIASVQGNTCLCSGEQIACVQGTHASKRRFFRGLQNLWIEMRLLPGIHWVAEFYQAPELENKQISRGGKKPLKMVLSVMFSSQVSACNPELNLLFRDWDLSPLILWQVSIAGFLFSSQ